MQDYAQQHGKGPQGVQFVEPATCGLYLTAVNDRTVLPPLALQQRYSSLGVLCGRCRLDETRLEPLHCRVDLGLRDSEGRHDADELWAREVQEESASVACR